jgi:hypothetical protein
MDAHALPLADASHDAIFCAFGVRNLSDLETATREQLRVLRPGGRLTILEFFRPTAFATRAVHALHNRTLLPLLGWAATGKIGAYLYLPRSIGRFATVEAYSELLRAVGFVDIRVERLTLGIAWVVRATRPEPREARPRRHRGQRRDLRPPRPRAARRAAARRSPRCASTGCARTPPRRCGATSSASTCRPGPRRSPLGPHDFSAPFASGSNAPDAVVLMPCSMSALARVAHGGGDDLLARACEVALKERRRLILVVRETPLSLVHLRNMVAATEAGAIILPAIPSFYGDVRTLEDADRHRRRPRPRPRRPRAPARAPLGNHAMTPDRPRPPP